MKRPTNITIACIVILMIIIICIFAFGVNKKPSKNNVENENVQSGNNVSYNTENTISENEDVTNEIQNTVNEELVQNEIGNIVENEAENATISTETFTEMPQDAQEKAIRIVENDWTGSDVSFTITGMDANGNYIVQVTDMNTEVLAFYTVNVSTETFTKKEMN